MKENKDDMEYREMHNVFMNPDERIHQIMEYGMQDVAVLQSLDLSQKLIESRYETAFNFGCPHVFGLYKSNTWFVKHYATKELIKNNFFPRTMNLPKSNEPSIQGAYNYSYGQDVVPPELPEVCYKTVQYDVRSMYPWIIIEFNLCPTTYLGIQTPHDYPESDYLKLEFDDCNHGHQVHYFLKKEVK